MNPIFNTIEPQIRSLNATYSAIANATIPHCIYCHKRMTFVESKGYNQPSSDRDCEPDFIPTAKIFECECGYKETIYL